MTLKDLERRSIHCSVDRDSVVNVMRIVTKRLSLDIKFDDEIKGNPFIHSFIFCRTDRNFHRKFLNVFLSLFFSGHDVVFVHVKVILLLIAR